MKRGLTYQEAMDYIGIKRRTFDAAWRPLLSPMRQGACLIFDRQDLDLLFDKFKREAAGDVDAAASDDTAPAHNAPGNGRPVSRKEKQRWAKQLAASTPQTTEPGKLTSGTPGLDFASAASAVLKKPKAG